MPFDTNHDVKYRSLFSHSRMVRDLFRGFLSEPWLEWLDLDSLESLRDTQRESPLDRLNEVLLWRLRWQGGASWVYLLLKLQNEEDPAMALRMSFYRELLYQDLLRHRSNSRLPVVLPIVVYGGKARWQAPRDALELFFPLPPALQRHVPRTRYLLLDILHDPIPATAGEDNLVSLLCGVERCRTPEGVDALLERLIALVSRPGDETLRQAWSAFLGRYFLPRHFPDLFTPEMMEAWGPEGVLA
jgi:hypothetical protein